MHEDNVDRLLKARAEIDEELRRHRVPLTILFTDVVGSTAYFDRFGDTAGLAMLQRHAVLASNTVVEFGGRVIKTIGDSVMAEFPEPACAVRAAQQIQRRITKLNNELPDRDRLTLRIGIHHGPVFRHGDDLYGDAVNVAARIAKHTQPSQILVSRSVFSCIASHENSRCIGKIPFKGKMEHEDIFEVPWMDEASLSASSQQSSAARVEAAVAAPAAPMELIAGRYKILQEVGRGGMGVVYKAEDTRLGRQVALKFLVEEYSQDQQALDRFRREARAASNLNHAHICTVYDIGENEGRPFIVMELLEGQTLKQRISGKALETEALLEWAIQIGDALGAAHSKGIVHRDIKPGNIHINTDGKAKVLDFGLAMLASERRIGAEAVEGSGSKSLSAPGSVMGTIAYMSPEQARGEKVDTRTDLFSFGAVMYEMATGQRAFSGATAASVLDAILNRPPEPALGGNRSLPAGLEAVVERCLEKDRQTRYQSASDLCSDLRRLKRDVETSRLASTPPKGSVLRTASRTQKSSKAVDSLAILPLTNLSGDPEMEYLSDGITDNLINSLVDLKKIRLAPRSMVFRYKGPNVDPQTAGRDLNVRAVLTGRVALRGETLVIGAELLDVAAVSQIWGAQYTRKFADVLVLQEEIAREISDKLRLQLSGEEKKRLAKRPAHDKETYQLYLKALYFSNRWSVENLKKATEYARKALDRDPTCAPAYAVLASASSMLGFYGFMPPGDAFPQARSAALKAIELDERLPDAHTTLALTLLLHYWDWEGCGRECRRAIELNGDSPLSWHIYGLYLMSQGRLPEASAAWKRAVEADPITPAWNFGLGLCYFCLRQYQQAIEQFRKTLELDSTNLNSQEFCTFSLVFQGKYDEAIASAEKISGFPNGAGPGKAILGYCYASAGRQQEARECLDELTAHPDGNPFSAYFSATLCTALREHDRAFELLNKLCERRFPALYGIRGIPMYDPLHSDPRFAGLLRRMGLPE